MGRTHLIRNPIDRFSPWIVSSNFRKSYLRNEDPVEANNSIPLSEKESTFKLKLLEGCEAFVERESHDNTLPSQPAVIT